MKVLFINTTCGRASHGKICGELASRYISEGHDCRIAYGRGSVPNQYRDIAVRIGNNPEVYNHVLKTKLFDAHGFASVAATRKFLKWADAYNPDLLWLHNIHGYYLNVELLFRWIKSRPNMQVKWTLHDCWAFTGHCGFFTMAHCEKWKTGCNRCPCKRDYPQSLFIDASSKNYQKKKELFTGVNKMLLITPSQWLANLTRESFLQEYPVEVINNNINTEIFQPTESNFREKNHFEDKKIILGVANVWHERKGLKDFLELSCMLDDSYQLILVGITQEQLAKEAKHFKRFDIPKIEFRESIRTKHGVAIPENVGCLYQAITGKAFDGRFHEPFPIMAISRTTDQHELAEMYSTADFFVNPTHEDNYPTTNLEAQACGAWTITYDVGGSKETIK